MASLPVVNVGDFLRTRALPTKMRCKVYDAAPCTGRYLETLLPDTVIGPVLSTVFSGSFETVQISAGWVNIRRWWRNRHVTQYAFKEPPPRVHVGDFLRTKDLPTKIRCKVYNAPPRTGRYLETLLPGTVIGPVLSIAFRDPFETVQIRSGWVNIRRWRRNGDVVQYALKETPPRAG